MVNFIKEYAYIIFTTLLWGGMLISHFMGFGVFDEFGVVGIIAILQIIILCALHILDRETIKIKDSYIKSLRGLNDSLEELSSAYRISILEQYQTIKDLKGDDIKN